MSPEELAVLIAATRLNECLMFDGQATEAMSDVTAGALQRLQQALELAAHPARSFISSPDPDGLVGQRVSFRHRSAAEVDPFSPEAQASMRRHPSAGIPIPTGPGVQWPPPGQPHPTGYAGDLPKPPMVGSTEEDDDGLDIDRPIDDDEG